jgi:phage shock protein PspC (stress-responsive transcriptional regulator)
MIGGVCGGLARYWNTDPVLLRILTVVLSLATGGAFVLVYLLAWLLIRDDPAGYYPQSGAGYAAGGNPGYGTPGTPGYLSPEGYPQAPPRERSYLGWLTVSAAILFAGVMGVIALVAPGGVSVAAITSAGMLTILGLGLLVGAVRGRARWLVIPAIPLAFITMGAVSASNWVADNPDWKAVASSGITAGDRTWKVKPNQADAGNLNFRLGMGAATLDLTDLTAPASSGGKRVPISVSIGLGQLTVIVPRDVEVQLKAQLQAGEVLLPKTRTSVTGGAQNRSPKDSSAQDGTLTGSNIQVAATVSPLAEKASYVIELDAAIGAGQLEVRREAA